MTEESKDARIAELEACLEEADIRCDQLRKELRGYVKRETVLEGALVDIRQAVEEAIREAGKIQ